VGDSLGAALEGAKAAVLQWVEQRVVQGVIAQLVTLCTPVGDAIEALVAAYNALRFFADNLRHIGQLVETLSGVLGRIACGDMAAAGDRCRDDITGAADRTRQLAIGQGRVLAHVCDSREILRTHLHQEPAAMRGQTTAPAAISLSSPIVIVASRDSRGRLVVSFRTYYNGM